MQQLKEKQRTLNIIASVAAVVDAGQVVINKGASDGIKFGQRFTLYELSEQDIIDPASGESLGRLETIKGTGKIVHIQDKLSILEAVSDNPYMELLGSRIKENFKNPKVGDKARPI